MNDSLLENLKKQIIEDKVSFLDTILFYVKDNKCFYSDNRNDLPSDMKQDIVYLEPFMLLVYRYNNTERFVPNGFKSVIFYKGVYLELKYFTGEETFISVKALKNIKDTKNVITLEMLKQKVLKEDEVKRDIMFLINKQLKDGLSFEEVSNLFKECLKKIKF